MKLEWYPLLAHFDMQRQDKDNRARIYSRLEK